MSKTEIKYVAINFELLLIDFFFSFLTIVMRASNMLTKKVFVNKIFFF